MRTPFVGREHELRALARQLDAGASVVLTGAYGSGRTALIGELARRRPSGRFVSWQHGMTTRAMRASAGARAGVMTGLRAVIEPGAVIVVDDIVRVSTQRLRSFRELTTSGCQIVAIVERSMRPEDLVRLRVALGAAPIMVVDSLSVRAADRYFALCCQMLGWGWSEPEIRATARATHGHPLTIRMTLEAAMARRPAEGPEPPTVSARQYEKKPSNGDGVRR